MPKKIYQSTLFMTLITAVEVDEVGYTIEFRGGKYFPEKVFGTYATSNVKVQKALEAHERYGSDFVLIRTIEDVKPVATEPVKELVKPVEPVADVLPTIDVETPEPTTITPTGEVLVNEVKNSQDAKLYLNKHFDVPFSRLKNVEMVVKESKIANLLFPNWKL